MSKSITDFEVGQTARVVSEDAFKATSVGMEGPIEKVGIYVVEVRLEVADALGDSLWPFYPEEIEPVEVSA